MYALDVAFGTHVGDGRDFFRVGLDARSNIMYPSSFPFGIPKTHFSGFSLMLNLQRFMNVAAKFVIRS